MSPPSLDEIWLYPVKGLRGHTVASAVVEARGLVGDRRCMVVDDEGAFITQRGVPQMIRVQARWLGGTIALEHEDARIEVALTEDGPPIDVRVWSSTVRAVELGEGSRFLSAALKRSCRLVLLPRTERRAVTSTSGREGDQVSFADAFPYLLGSTSSFADLVTRASDPSLTMERFRPNLVVRGLAPWAEDEASELTIGGLRFFNRKPCDRCSVTLIDPDSGKIGKEPLRTLATFREREGKVYFGANLVAESTGQLRVGDSVSIPACAKARTEE